MKAALSLAFLLLALPSVAAPERPRVAWLDVDGAIGPASADYIQRSLHDAAEMGASFAVMRIDTPGGLDESMRHIVQDILTSPIPVVGYVAPSGARAASAGTFLLYACHVAAMAPGTTLGAATPVSLQGPGAPEAPPPDDGESDGESGALGARERKVLEDAVSYIRGLAELRGRNADWAESAVREGQSLSAPRALERDVIDIVADDREALLNALDGREVQLDGAAVTLRTTGADVVPLEPDWRTRVLAVITNPNVALLLLMLGLYGVIFELASPGMIIPGVLGAVFLAVGLYALHVLPLSYAGLALLLLGVALLVGEALAPSFGLLGVGGVVAFVIGSLMLIDTEVPAFRVSRPVLLVLGGTSVAFLIAVVRMAVRSRRQRSVTGSEALVGAQGRVLEDWAANEGWVGVGGERWHATSDAPLAPGTPIEIVAIDGLRLRVRPSNAAVRPGGS